MSTAYGSTYVAWFHPIAFGPPLVSRRVEASTFAEVEDWAHEHLPEGESSYELRSIEKHYGTDAELAMYGPVDADLHEAVS